MSPLTRPGLRSSRAWPPRLEPGAQAVGQGLGRRTDRGDGGVVVHAFGSYEADDTVGPLVVAVGRRNQARAHQVVESVLGAYQDGDALERSSVSSSGVVVLIGAENALYNLMGTSLVAAAYGHHQRPYGVVSLIGPKRMDYDAAITTVRSAAETLTHRLSTGF